MSRATTSTPVGPPSSNPTLSASVQGGGVGPTEPPPHPESATGTLLAPLENLHTLALGLFASLAPPQTRPPPPPPVSAFLAADEALANSVQRAREHQARQRRIASLMEEVLSLEAKWRATCAELERGKRELSEMIEEGDVRVRAMDKAKEAAVPYPELLQYAQSISAFTSAPPNMPDMSLPGQPPPPLFFPPFPNEEKMRRGRLNAEAPLGQLGETHSVGRPPSLSPSKAIEGAQGANQSYRHDTRPQQQFFDLDLDLNPDL